LNRASGDRRIKKAAKMELSHASSQLDRLREELEGINSAFHVYQFDEYGNLCVDLILFSFNERVLGFVIYYVYL